MTDDRELPTDVVALLHRSLPSMAHVELLLLLARITPKGCRMLDAAAELRTDPNQLSTALVDLGDAKLLKPGPEPGEVQLDAADPAMRATIAQLQDIYDRRPVTLVKVLYQRPASPAKAFADAFRLRSEGSK